MNWAEQEKHLTEQPEILLISENQKRLDREFL